MTRIDVSVEIAAPPDRVWNVVEPIENHIEWMRDAVAIRFQSEQTRGIGTTFLCDTKIGPIKLVDKMEITDWQPGIAMGVRHTGIVTGTGQFTLVPTHDQRGTIFSWVEDLTFPWWLGGRVGSFIGARIAMKPLWKRNLNRLRTLVEAS